MENIDVAVIGGGPGGIAAAVQLRRSGLGVVLYEATRLGGLLWNARRVDNYPGFPGGVAGPALAGLLAEHVAAAGVTVRAAEVRTLDYDGSRFIIEDAGGAAAARAAVVASGTKPKTFADVTVTPEVWDRIRYDVVGLREERGRKFVVVGGGDAAFDYALTLAANNEVVILNRGPAKKCLPALGAEAAATSAIRYCANARITALASRGGGVAVAYDTPTHSAESLADYVVFAIGREPASEFLAPQLVEKRRELETAGILHFIGDVKNGRFRQTAIAAGEGVAAGMALAARLGEARP